MTRPLQFIPFKSRSDKGWAEAGSFTKSRSPTTNAGTPKATTGHSATRISKPTASGAATSSSASSSTGVPTGTVMSSTWPSHPPCGDKTWAPRHSRPSAGRSGASSSRSTHPQTTFRSAACTSTSGWVRRQPLPVHPPVVPQAFHAPPAGADELSRRHHLRRSPQFRGLRTGGSPPLFGARSPHSAEFSVKADRFQQDNGSDRHRPFSGGISFPASPAMQTMQADRRIGAISA